MSYEQNEQVLEALDTAVYSRNGWWRINCCFCLLNQGTDDKRRSLGVHVEGKWHCFRCHEWGHLEDDVPDWIGQKRDTGVVEEDIEAFDPPEGYIPLYEDPGLTAISLAQPRDYLLDRGLGRDVWDYAGIGACLDGPFERRIIIPVFDPEGTKWIGYVGRYWTAKVPKGKLKYRYPPGMKRDRLYDGALLREETDDPALVVEGVMDALPYFGQAVACLGKPTKAHYELFKQSKRPLAICLDGDAWREALALSMRLKLEGVRAGYVRLPADTDPNDADRDWLLDQARKCIV